MEERIYTIPLLRAKMAPRTRRAKKAIKIIKDFLRRHTKVETIKIDRSINEAVWARGLRKVPSRIRVKAVKIEDEVWAYAPEAEIRKEKEKEEKEEIVEEREEKTEEKVEEKEEEKVEEETIEEEKEEKAEEIEEEAKEEGEKEST